MVTLTTTSTGDLDLKTDSKKFSESVRGSVEIPRILHQTWKNAEIPERWRRFQQGWLAHNPDWKLMFWTDESGREFIKQRFAWFLPVYDKYPHGVMRADALRYCLLSYFGGIYADMDYECLRPFDPLLDGRELVFGKEPEAHCEAHQRLGSGLDWLVCNALMCSVPNHEFWDHLIGRMAAHRGDPGPLDATGPFLLTRAYLSYSGKQSILLLESGALSPLTQREAQLGRGDDEAYKERLAERSWAVHHWDNTWVPLAPDLKIPEALEVHLMEQRRITAHSSLRLDVRKALPHALPEPLVSCLMVTGNRPGLAALSIQCFRSQTYSAKELIIVDDSGTDALARHVESLGDPAIRYVAIPLEQKSLGELRNLAVAHAAGEYVAQWDDDDLSHPRRLEVQMASLQTFGADASFLLQQFQWWPRQQRMARSRSRVWEATMLCRKDRLSEYPARRQGEDTVVVSRLMTDCRLALLNLPQLYLYVRHGANTFGEEHFERSWKLADAQYEDRVYKDLLEKFRGLHPIDEYIAGLPQSETPDPQAPRQAPAVVRPAFEPGEFREHRILVLTPVKNAARHLERYAANLKALSHPHENISIGWLESDSTDGSFAALRDLQSELSGEFRRVSLFQRHYHFHPTGPRWAPGIQKVRRSILARSRNELLMRTLSDEHWVLWLDADVSEYPADLIEQLLVWRKEILVADCVHEYGGRSFDRNTFQKIDDPVAMHDSVHLAGTLAPVGDGRRYLDELRDVPLVPVDSVGGTALLVNADLHRQGLNFPPYPYKDLLETEGLAAMAKDMGVQCWALPSLQVLHPRG